MAHSLALPFARADLATAAPNGQPSAQTNTQSQWHHPLRKVVTCWQGDNTEPPVPPKVQRLVLSGMGTCFRPGLAGPQWACVRAAGFGPLTQTPAEPHGRLGAGFIVEELQWA